MRIINTKREFYKKECGYELENECFLCGAIKVKDKITLHAYEKNPCEMFTLCGLCYIRMHIDKEFIENSGLKKVKQMKERCELCRELFEVEDMIDYKGVYYCKECDNYLWGEEQ